MYKKVKILLEVERELDQEELEYMSALNQEEVNKAMDEVKKDYIHVFKSEGMVDKEEDIKTLNIELV